MTQRYRTGLFDSLGAANLEASNFFAEERQRQANQQVAQQQADTARLAEQRAAERDRFDRVSVYMESQNAVFKYLDDNDKYLTPEGRQLANQYRARYNAAQQQFLLTGDGTGFDQLATEFPNGQLGVAADGSVIDFQTIRQGVTTNKPKVDFAEQVAAKTNQGFADLVTGALNLVTDPQQQQAIRDAVAEATNSNDPAVRAQAFSRITTIVSQNNVTGFMAANRGKIGSDKVVTAIAYNLLQRGRPVNPEQAAAFDDLAQILGVDPNTLQPLANQTEGQRFAYELGRSTVQGGIAENRRAGLENDQIAAQTGLTNYTAARVAALTSLEVKDLETKIALAEQQYAKNNQTTPLEIQRLKDEATARRLELERAEATQASKIAADLSTNALTSQAAQAAIKNLGYKTEAEAATLINSMVQLGAAGAQGLQNLAAGGLISQARANELAEDAKTVQLVRDAANAAAIAASNANVAQSALSQAEATAALDNVPLNDVAARAKVIGEIAARGDAGKATLDALLKAGKIKQHEYEAGKTAAQAAQSAIDRTRIGEDRATAVAADARYLSGASSFTSQANRAKHIDELRRADPKAFEETARLLGFANGDVYEDDLLSRANAAAMNTELGRQQAAAQTAQTRAQTNSILANDDLSRRKFEQEKQIQNAANQRAQESHAAAKKAAQQSRNAESLRNSPLNLSIQNVRGGLTQLERARDTITNRQTAITNRIAELKKAQATPGQKPIGQSDDAWNKWVAERNALLQAEIDNLVKQQEDNARLLQDTQSEIDQSRELLGDMNRQLSQGRTTYTPSAASLPPIPSNGTYTRNGQTIQGSPQQPSDWVNFRPTAVAESVIKDTMGSGKFSIPELLSTYRSEGLPPSQSTVYSTISARLTNMFTATGAVNNLENRIAFLDWLERNYGVSIPDTLDEVWVKG